MFHLWVFFFLFVWVVCCLFFGQPASQFYQKWVAWLTFCSSWMTRRLLILSTGLNINLMQIWHCSNKNYKCLAQILKPLTYVFWSVEDFIFCKCKFFSSVVLSCLEFSDWKLVFREECWWLLLNNISILLPPQRIQ